MGRPGEVESLLSELIVGDLQEHNVAYVMVNEAGASVYSTSQYAREELPDFEAAYRGAVSIGRRLLDPLLELVKIEPANIGVGLYRMTSRPVIFMHHSMRLLKDVLIMLESMSILRVRHFAVCCRLESGCCEGNHLIGEQRRARYLTRAVP